MSNQKTIIRAVILGTCILGGLIAAYVIWQYCVSSVRGSVVSYYSTDRYSGQKTISTGRIIALPGELIRFNLQNNQIYIRRSEQAYKLIEHYLPEDSATFSLAFDDGWRILTQDEMLVMNDSRIIESMLDFVAEEAIIKQSQIIEILRSGKHADTTFQKINEAKEFAPKVEPSWMAWQTQVSDHINLKNVATPVVHEGVVYAPMRNNSLVAIDAASGKHMWEQSFSTNLNKITFEENTKLISVITEDKNQHSLDRSNGKVVEQKRTNSNGLDFGIDQSELSLQAEGVVVEKQKNEMLLTKTNIEGKILWQYRSDDLKYFPTSFRQYGQYLVGLGGYGGNSYEDVPLVATIYVFHADTGVLTTKVENLSYVNYEVVGNTLLVFDKILEGFDITKGKKIWSSAISGDSGSTSKPWLIDQSRNLVVAADAQQIVALQVQDGKLVWQQTETNNYARIFLKNQQLFVVDMANDWLQVRDINNGKSLWQTSAVGISQPHITESNQVFFRGGKTVKLQYLQNTFSTLNSTTHQPIPIFSHITHAENDLLIQYEGPFIYVFTDDSVTAIRYQAV